MRPFQLANMPGNPYAANPSAGGVYQSIAAQLTPSSVFVTPNQRENQRQRSQLTPIPEANPMQMALAKQMMATGSSTAPVRSPLEGLARALTGVAGGYFAGEANRAQDAREGARGERLATVLGLDPEVAQGLSSDEMVAAATLRGKDAAAEAKGMRPMSTVGKIQQDFEAGLLTQAQYDAAVDKATTSKPLVNVDLGETYDEKAAERRAMSDQDYRTELRKGANAARRQRTTLKRMRSLIGSGDVSTGALQPLKRSVGALLSAFNLDPEDYGLGDLATAQEVRALSNQLVLGELDKVPGALSEKELDFVTAATAGESLTPETNLALLDLALEASQRQVDQYAALRKWNREFGSPGAVNKKGQDFETMWDAYIQEQGESFEPPETVQAVPETVGAGMVPEITADTDLTTLDMEPDALATMDLSKMTEDQKKQWDKMMDAAGL